MNLRNGLLLSALVLAGLTTACGSKQEAKNATNDKVHELKLMDTYKSECDNLVLDGLGLGSRKVEFVITGSIDKVTTYYSSDDCQGKVLTIKSSGAYENVDTVADNSDIGRIDITMNKAEVTPHTSQIVEKMNQVGYCGIRSWEQKTRDVSSSADAVNCPGTETLGRTSYDIFSTRNGELRFGLAVPVAHDKSTPEKRPTTLAPEVVARR